jgi:hypothetical protein
LYPVDGYLPRSATPSSGYSVDSSSYLDEESIPIAIVIPKHLCPHTHPPPPATRVPTDVRLLYERAVRTYGISIATVNKVEQGESNFAACGSQSTDRRV